MTAQKAYLEKELVRYWPGSQVHVSYPGDEIIAASILIEHCEPIILRYEIGSDDDYYRFVSADGIVLTVPYED